ncbi:MAG TPA: hypothetical protein VHO50_01395 [Bacteroidales bacterium]|nr:hypothetical protein [Bacteroidales bacterium]
MKNVFLSLILLAGVYGLANGQQDSRSKSSADDPDWEKIGEKTIDLSMERGVFDLNSDRGETVNANEVYSAIKFKAKDAPLSLTSIEVEYESGKKQELTENSPVVVAENTESEILDLNTTGILDKITFNFGKDEIAGADKAKIEIWGLKSKSEPGMSKMNPDMDHSEMDKSSTKPDKTRVNTDPVE